MRGGRVDGTKMLPAQIDDRVATAFGSRAAAAAAQGPPGLGLMRLIVTGRQIVQPRPPATVRHRTVYSK